MSYKINIITNQGHFDLEEDTPKKALDTILKEADGGEKWIYVDSVLIQPDQLTEDTIKRSKYIALTNPLIGG